MKKTHAYLLTMWLSICTMIAGYSAGPIEPDQDGINSLAVAMKLAEGIQDQYFDMSYKDVEGEWKWMQGLITKDDRVIELSVNDVPILEIGESLPGIPFPQNGVFISCNFYLSARNANGGELASGFSHYPYLHVGENFSVYMYTTQNSFTLDLPGKPGDELFMNNVYVGYYDEYQQKFICWAPMVNSLSGHEYKVYNDGEFVSAGFLDNFYRPIQGVGQSFGFVSPEFAGGVVIMKPGVQSRKVDFELDGWLALPGQPAASGKAFVLDAKGGMSYDVRGNYDVAVLYALVNGDLHEIGRHLPGAMEWSYAYPEDSPDDSQLILGIFGGEGNEVELRVSFWADYQGGRG